MDKSCGEKCERARKEGLFYVKTKQARTDYTCLLRFLSDVLGVSWWLGATDGHFPVLCAERGGLPNLRAPPIDLPTPLIASAYSAYRSTHSAYRIYRWLFWAPPRANCRSARGRRM